MNPSFLIYEIFITHNKYSLRLTLNTLKLNNFHTNFINPPHCKISKYSYKDSALWLIVRHD